MVGSDVRHGRPATPRPAHRPAHGAAPGAARADRGAVRGTLALVLVLALVAGGLAAWHYDVIDRFRGADDAAAGPADPTTVAPPTGVEAPEVTAPDPVAAPSPRRGVDAAAVRAALAPYLGDRDLGRHLLVEVAPLTGARAAFTSGRGTAMPASTTKVVTTTAALLALGPDHVFTTEVRASGNRIALVGGGDPYLERGPVGLDGAPWPYPARADLETLAQATAEALRADGRRRVRLVVDDSAFTGPAENPTWEDDYVSSGEAAPTSALWVDQGRVRTGLGRVPDPAVEAGTSFAEALAAAGITVVGAPTRGVLAGAPVLASVDSPPLRQIVERALEVSDNDASEVLLRQVGIAVGGEGSIEAGRAGVRTVLRRAGIDLGASELYDGSGLSRQNRLDPSVLVDVLRLAASGDHPGLRPVVTGLPVAGFTGSLTDRMTEGPFAGLGRVRAKTGTLSAVTSLAGLATDVDGTVLVFALMADRVSLEKGLDARVVMDAAAAALGACACAS
ncbi:D-alanyl-D-alanine carboxypeptidase/D-alanyl-D-alanine-endopeptidase [Nocardioides sp. 1609]|uniref:D-alanyl-D-alanine carboxypeptidase/D-alanyl-D-alanine endopeptidase n=1 Tax=Nocardioides sp. 1609 TaxID=2508327 RepID=UPI0010702DAB|nr:D-alanyl-D-alanine carboxypeptidase/D-alanyl-D-alanine-endopeptidase [Nocardioides sp. 1609]